MEHGDIKVEVEDEHIVVSMEGTSFRTAYFKSADEPRLIQSPTMSVEKEAPLNAAKSSRRSPGKLPNAKAREFGWIV